MATQEILATESVFYVQFRNVSTGYVPCAGIVQRPGLDRSVSPATAAKMRPSHEAAREHLREMLTAQLAEKEAAVRMLKFNLKNLESLYPKQPSLFEQLSGQYGDLVAELARLAEAPGSFKFGPLRVTNTYCNSAPTLFVFDLDEYSPVVETFNEASCELIEEALTEAGHAVRSSWNGAGSFSFSVQAFTSPSES